MYEGTCQSCMKAWQVPCNKLTQHCGSMNFVLPSSTKALEQDQASSYAQIRDKVEPHMRLVLSA